MLKRLFKSITKSSKYVYLLDAGHGGIIDGVYQTSGKRSPIWSDGSQLFEGEFNRDIVKRLSKLLRASGIRYKIITPEQNDISLKERVRRANNYHTELGKKCILFSIHGNGGGGTGFEVFTSKGTTRSDGYATILFNQVNKLFPNKKMRSDVSDGDPDKEAQFYILKHTMMPAILSENFFMDQEIDCRLMLSDEGRQKIAEAHFNAIKIIEG